MQTNGRHLLMEYQGCEHEILNDSAWLKEWMKKAAIAARATVIAEVFHSFSPTGTSGVLVLQESHLSIHTWPERGYAAMDFYTCGDCDPFEGHLVLLKGLKPTRFEIMDVTRGELSRAQSLGVVGHAVEGRVDSFSARVAAGGQR